MSVPAWVKARVKERLARVVQGEVRRALADLLPLLPQLMEFHNSPIEERQSYHDHTKNPLGNLEVYAAVRDRLAEAGVPVDDEEIDLADFERWLGRSPAIRRYYRREGAYFIEGCLQHYLAFRYLKLSKGDVYVDVGGGGSPFADVLRRMGIRSYRLDVIYPKGVHGMNIGSDASDTDLPSGFASVLSAQDAFELFVGDADIRFLGEAARILNSQGRLGIVPLYLDDQYFVALSPFHDLRGITIDSGAMRLWRDDGVSTPFSRHYSPESFKERILANLPPSMTGKVFYFRNLPDLMRRYPGQRIYSFFMFYCDKH